MENHGCIICGRWGCFGIADNGRNSHHTWWCADHVPRDQFDTLTQTTISQFEEAFLGLKKQADASQPATSTTPRSEEVKA